MRVRILAVFALLLAPPALGQEFNRCAPCHAIGVDAVNKVGPQLNGVVGRPVAGLDDYSYSATLQREGAEGDVSTEKRLLRFFKSPRHFYPGTSMAFAGFVKRSDAEAMISYLKGFAPDGSAAQ